MSTEPQTSTSIEKVTPREPSFPDELISKFVPIFYLHPKEKYYPCSIDWLLNRSKFQYTKATLEEALKDPTKIITIKEAPITSVDLFEYCNQNGIYGQTGIDTLWFDFSDSVFPGQKDDKNEIPTYVHYRETDEGYMISYSLLFPYNGAKQVIGCVPVGDHKGDVEAVSLQIDKQTLEVKKAWYGAHGTAETRIVYSQDMSFEEGRPVVYVAINSHAMAERQGSTIRFGGFGNDVYSKGEKINPKPVRVFGFEDGFSPEKDGWATFAGRIGKDGVASLADKDWFKGWYPTPEACQKAPPFIDAKMGCCDIM